MSRVPPTGWLVRRASCHLSPARLGAPGTHTRAHTQGRGALSSAPAPPTKREHTHTLFQGKVIEVSFFSWEEKVPSIERMYSQNLGKLICTQPPNYPQVAVLHGGLPTFLSAGPLFPSAPPWELPG